ncbi:hypothetical protein ACQ4LE_007888 [Meloidogyne hapla]
MLMNRMNCLIFTNIGDTAHHTPHSVDYNMVHHKPHFVDYNMVLEKSVVEVDYQSYDNQLVVEHEQTIFNLKHLVALKNLKQHVYNVLVSEHQKMLEQMRE